MAGRIREKGRTEEERQREHNKCDTGNRRHVIFIVDFIHYEPFLEKT
jgi:hypothetical protein